MTRYELKYNKITECNKTEKSRAGGNFRGQMRQHFVVLDDQEMHNTKFSAPPPHIAQSNPVAGGSNLGKEQQRGTKRGNNEMGSGSGSEADGGKRNQPRS